MSRSILQLQITGMPAQLSTDIRKNCYVKTGAGLLILRIQVVLRASGRRCHHQLRDIILKISCNRMTPRIKFSLIGASAFVILFAAGEWSARSLLGLGTPPLYIEDPRIEYFLAPNQELHRFGNRISVNQWSMRSDRFNANRPAGTRRILVFGDSVVWGGSQMDQSEIATSLLQQSLRKAASGKTIEVGNVAAGSWGPGNWLAYAQHFGFFNATDLVLVISSHDASDNPTHTPLKGDSNKPTTRPISALLEGLNRYLLPKLQSTMSKLMHAGASSPSNQEPLPKMHGSPVSSDDPRVQQGLKDLESFLLLAKMSGARVSVVQFWDREETLSSKLQPSHDWIAKRLASLGIPSVQSGPGFQNCAKEDGFATPAVLYADGIHPYTSAGQACLARSIEKALK